MCIWDKIDSDDDQSIISWISSILRNSIDLACLQRPESHLQDLDFISHQDVFFSLFKSQARTMRTITRKPIVDTATFIFQQI